MSQSIVDRIVNESGFDAHLDQFGDQSGGWGSEEQLGEMWVLSGALRVLFCERNGVAPTTLQDHLWEADRIRTVHHPSYMPSQWRLGREYWLHVEGLECISDQVDVLKGLSTFHEWGVRGSNPIYHRDNPLGGCSKESGVGLTEFGRTFLQGMWALGWWIDLAHMSEQSISEVLAMMKRLGKLCYTHGGVRHSAISDPILTVGNIERSISMEQALVVVQSGGLVCISPCRPFYNGLDNTFLEHIRTLGEASDWNGVGIGTDYGGILDSWRFDGCLTVADCFRAVTTFLLDSGLTEQQVRRVIGLNARRFFLGYSSFLV